MQLKQATRDHIALTHEVSIRLHGLHQDHIRYLGTSLIVPQDLESDYKRFADVRDRFRKADFRLSEAEYKSLKVIADWTVQINCKLRHQPYQPVQWGD